jgi:hypothetical protein
MDVMRNAYKVLIRKREENIPFGRHARALENKLKWILKN